MRCSSLLAIVAIGLELSVSANLLTWVGVPYVTEGGPLPFKIHPGTYFIGLAFLVFLLRQFRPGSHIRTCLGGDARLALFFSSMLACIFYAFATTGTGNLIVLVDTFIPAGLLAAVLHGAPAEELLFLRRLLQWGIFGNAALALIEAFAHSTIVPLYLNETEFHPATNEFRPTALYDHPLTGGVMTLIGLALVPVRGFARLPFTLVLWAGLLAFGGRAAVVVALLSAACLTGIEVARRVLQRDKSVIRVLLTGVVLIVLGAGAIGAAGASGLGDRLFAHLYWDPSAQVRLAQWGILGDLDSSQVVFGTRREDLLGRLNLLWLNAGVEVIENFWLLMFASLGTAGFPIFVAGFFGLLAWCWRRSGLHGRALVLSVIAVASTSNSLGRKSTILVGLVAAVASMPRQRALVPL